MGHPQQTHTHTCTHAQSVTGHCLSIGATDAVLSDRTRECRAPPVTRISRSHAAGLRLQVHDAIDHLDIQGARQPALHEPPMNQGLGAHDFVTPCRWVCHPPSLQSKPSMAMNSLSPFCFVVGFERLSEFVNEGHFSWWHMVILVRLDDWTCVMHVTAQQDGCQQG